MTIKDQLLQIEAEIRHAKQNALSELNAIQEKIAGMLSALPPEPPKVPTLEEVYKIMDKKIHWECPTGDMALLVPCGNHGIQLLAIADLMVMAAYVNDGWEPNWNDREQEKFRPSLQNGEIDIDEYTILNAAPVYFKSREAAETAIAIMGAERMNHYFGIHEAPSAE